MKFNLKKILHSITLRVPQQIAHRNGMRVATFNTADNSLYWSIFTSDEYLSFVPFLLKANLNIKKVIDCGAACGYFSMLIEHLCRSKVLPWHPQYCCIEPGEINFYKLSENFKQPIFTNRFILLKAAIGLLTGKITFYESKSSPWSSSMNARSNIRSKKVEVQFVDITPHLKTEGILLKLDIEGAEFLFVNEYKDKLENVDALIIEWHHDEGDINQAKTILSNAGLVLIHQSRSTDRRSVQLYMRNFLI
jgi:FkbM family methyltransferase